MHRVELHLHLNLGLATLDALDSRDDELANLGVALLPTDSDCTQRFLVAAPTMKTPGAILSTTPHNRTVYRATLAAMKAWRECDEIGSLAMPMFGTGWGSVPAWVAAAQVWEAFVDAWRS